MQSLTRWHPIISGVPAGNFLNVKVICKRCWPFNHCYTEAKSHQQQEFLGSLASLDPAVDLVPSCRCSVGVNTRHLGLLRKVSVMVVVVFCRCDDSDL